MTTPKKRIYIADDSLDGILTAVRAAYMSRLGHANITILVDGEDYTLDLFSEYEHIHADPESASRVLRSIYEKIGREAAVFIEYTAASHEPDRAETIYRFLVLGFHNGPKAFNAINHACVERLHKIGRRVMNERNHWLEFLRFEERGTVSGYFDPDSRDTSALCLDDSRDTPAPCPNDSRDTVLFATIAPKARILPYIMPHFSDRYPSESFIIWDETHSIAGIHPAKGEWFLISDLTDDERATILKWKNCKSDEEAQMQELWRIFFKATDIPERENKKLQRGLMPLWFRKNMTEAI